MIKRNHPEWFPSSVSFSPERLARNRKARAKGKALRERLAKENGIVLRKPKYIKKSTYHAAQGKA